MTTIADSYNTVFGQKKRILIVTAHPDDNEVICGGLVARLISDNKEVRLVVTTNGEKGNGDSDFTTEEFAKIRTAEQMKAAQILGISSHECINLGIADGEIEASIENIKKIVFHIREFKPDIVITHCPDEVINTFSSKENVRWVNHRDHRHTAIITADAVYPYSRDKNFFVDQLQEGLAPHIVTDMCFSDSYEHALNHYFDVTEFIDKKRLALSACPSVIEPKHVEDYIEETRVGNKYYEQLRFVSGLF